MNNEIVAKEWLFAYSQNIGLSDFINEVNEALGLEPSSDHTISESVSSNSGVCSIVNKSQLGSDTTFLVSLGMLTGPSPVSMK